MNKFIKEEEIITTKKVINYGKDYKLPNSALMSVADGVGGDIKLVIGAKYEYGGACYFGKDSLKKLIEILQEIHDVME